MKYLVISDTHGKTKDLIRFIKDKLVNEIDGIFFLGDYVEDGELLGKELNIKTYIVAGNGDLGFKYKLDLLVEVEDKKIFLTHGHKYNISMSMDRIYYRGLEYNADIVLYGHTHIPSLLEMDDLIIMNPGSPSYPRADNKKKTIGLLNVEENITIDFIEVGKEDS